MSKTTRNGTITMYVGVNKDKLLTFNRYWMKHDPSWYRRHLNRKFKRQEKQYFMKFGEPLRKSKNRGYWW